MSLVWCLVIWKSRQLFFSLIKSFASWHLAGEGSWSDKSVETKKSLQSFFSFLRFNSSLLSCLGQASLVVCLFVRRQYCANAENCAKAQNFRAGREAHSLSTEKPTPLNAVGESSQSKEITSCPTGEALPGISDGMFRVQGWVSKFSRQKFAENVEGFSAQDFSLLRSAVPEPFQSWLSRCRCYQGKYVVWIYDCQDGLGVTVVMMTWRWCFVWSGVIRTENRLLWWC